MWKSIKREFLLNVDSLWQFLAIIGGAWGIGLIIDAAIFYFSKDDEVFIVGLIASAMALVCLGILFPAFFFSSSFEQAVKLGCTRRAFLMGMAVTELVHTLCGTVLVIILAFLESWIGRLTLPDRYSIGKLEEMLAEIDGSTLAVLGIALGAMLELACAGIFLGACMQRWGQKAFWGIYIVGMVICFFGSSVNMIDTDTLLGRIWRALSQAASFVPGFLWTALAILVLPAFAAVGVCMLLHASVRSAA